METLLHGLQTVVSLQNLLFLVLGFIVGMILGAIPGITGSVGMAALLPVCFYMEPISAIVFLCGIYTGSVTGGSVSAVLMNMPGTPAAIATAMDGFVMTQKGMPQKALGLSLMSSVTGQLISYVLLMLLIVPAASLVSKLGPAERCAITVCAVLIVATLKGNNPLRNLAAGLLGLAIGTLGTSDTGVFRGAFLGNKMLSSGIPQVPSVIGLLAFSELIVFLGEGTITKQLTMPSVSTGGIIREIRTVLHHWKVCLMSNVIGFIIGVIPAAGASVASVFCYGQAKSWSKHPEDFGNGSEEGIVASESANNASVGGAMLTMLALGIPGSGAAAILMSAFMMFGLIPGPVWIVKNVDFVYAIGWANIFLVIIMVFLGAWLMSKLAYVIKAPVKYLAPALLLISSIGIYSLRNSIFDVFLTWGFAYLGFILKKHDFSPMAVMLGIMMAPSIESELYRISRIYAGNYLEPLTRPVVVIAILASVFLIFSAFRQAIKKKAASKKPDLNPDNTQVN